MPRCALGSSAALGYVQGVHAIVSMLARGVHRHASHVIERRIKRQPRAHPQVHVGTEIVTRRPEIVLVIACEL